VIPSSRPDGATAMNSYVACISSKPTIGGTKE
jgi:hypothetical protein